MKAVTCKSYGPPEVLEIVDVPVPKPKLNQVLIKVQATSVNSGDVRLRGLDVGNLPGAVFVKFIMRCIVGFKAPRKKILKRKVSDPISCKNPRARFGNLQKILT